MKKLLTTGILTSYRPRVDGSFSLSVNILIPNKEQKGVIDDLFQQEVVIYIREGNEIAKEEIEIIDEMDIEMGETKTPGQRMRNILFRLHEQKPEGFSDFKQYYKFKMNQLNEHLKGKLE